MLDSHAGTRLRQAIKEAGTTNAALAEALGVSAQAIGYWIKTGNIARERLTAIRKELRVSLDWLLVGDESGKQIQVSPLNRALLTASIRDVIEHVLKLKKRPPLDDIAEVTERVYEEYLAEQDEQRTQHRDPATLLRLVSSR